MTNLTVTEQGQPLTFSFEDALRYHGPGFPGGVAHGFQAMAAALPLLNNNQPIERRELQISTAFPGPGARDAFELVTRTLTDGRYEVDPNLADDSVEESPKGRYYFRFTYRDTAAEATIKPGHVRPEFITLARKANRTEADEVRLAELKQEMADRLMAQPATDIYQTRVLRTAVT